MVVQFLALKLFKWKESTPKSADHHFPPPNCHWDFHPPFFGRPTSQPPIPCLSWKYATNACCSNSSRGTTASATRGLNDMAHQQAQDRELFILYYLSIKNKNCQHLPPPKTRCCSRGRLWNCGKTTSILWHLFKKYIEKHLPTPNRLNISHLLSFTQLCRSLLAISQTNIDQLTWTRTIKTYEHIDYSIKTYQHDYMLNDVFVYILSNHAILV